ncbi:unnamed protein product [Calypogeia fissa]
MRKGGISSAPSTPRGGSHGRGQTPQLAEEHHIVATTFVQADVSTFRELVQKLTGGPPSPVPQLPSGSSEPAVSTCKEPSPVSLRRDNILAGRPELERIMSVKPVGGPGPQRTSTAKLLERRQNAKKLEVKHLMGPHILKRTVSPALSPVSPLTNVDVFGEHNGNTSPLGYMGYSAATPPPAPRLSFDLEQPAPDSSPGFDLNSGVINLDLERQAASPREPRLLPLFPLHSPRSLSS